MNKIDSNVMLGQEFPVRVFPGKDGHIISRLPDGRPLLFGQQFIMTPKLRNGDIVKIRVIKPTATYVLVQPVALLDQSALPSDLPEAAPTGEFDTYTIDSPSIPEAPLPVQNTGRVDQYIEKVIVTNYKCKLCNTTLPQRNKLERHIAEDHNVQYG